VAASAAATRHVALDDADVGAAGSGPRVRAATLPARAAEAVAVLASPVVLFYLLRLRRMAPPALPDPGLHTAFIVHPQDMLTRYSALFAATERMREGARVGFLAPARLAYLVYGAVPGFFVTRFVFALIAVVPAYLLLRRLYGGAAGAIGIVTILSCPVIITAWGTDYPDSAVVSYLIGALSCLAMPCSDRWRRSWLVCGGGLLTMAVWSHGAAVPLVAATLVVYGLVRITRARRRLLGDLVVVGVVAVAVTGLLSIASEVELGRFDFIVPTWDSFRFLSQPSQIALWHSSNWHWVLYDSYLLVPPAVVGAWLVTCARPLRAVPTPQLFIGLSCAAQVLIFAYLQFLGTVQVLEDHYFSSQLWASVCLLLALTVAEMARPLLDHRPACWTPVVLLLAVPLLYEADPHVPAFGWLDTGIAVAALLVAVPWVTRCLSRALPKISGWLAIAAGLVALSGGVLVLTVAGSPAHAPLANVVSRDDPAPAYATALGGSAGNLIGEYRVASELPDFVGNATYQGEILEMWWPREFLELNDTVSMYHAGFDSLPMSLPLLTAQDVSVLDQRRPPELLLLSTTGAEFPAAVKSLAPFHPRLAKVTVLGSGPVAVHAWLILLERFVPPGR
jgi:hypothetical protein